MANLLEAISAFCYTIMKNKTYFIAIWTSWKVTVIHSDLYSATLLLPWLSLSMLFLDILDQAVTLKKWHIWKVEILICDTRYHTSTVTLKVTVFGYEDDGQNQKVNDLYTPQIACNNIRKIRNTQACVETTMKTMKN